MGNKHGNTPADKREANYIDKIIKENCQNLVPFIFRKIFKLQYHKIENMPEVKQQVTVEKEPDFLRIVYNDDYPDGVVVQLEFESGDAENMDKRMLMYLAMLYWNTDKPILQFVFFLGAKQVKVKSIIRFGNLDYQYGVINIQDFSYKDFIHSEYSEEVILSILADTENLNYDELIDLILQRLVELNGNTLATRKFVKQLIMLSRLRNLQNLTIKKVRTMRSMSFDINNDILYLEGIEKGLEQGIEKGIQKGMQKGIEKGMVQGLEQGLAKGAKYGKLKIGIKGIKKMTDRKVDKKLISEFLDLEVDFVEKIQKQLLKNKEIVALLKEKDATKEKVAKKLKVHPILVEILQEDLQKKN